MAEERYIPSEESVKFIAFIRAAGVEDNANAEIHYRLADKYFSKDKQIVVAVSVRMCSNKHEQ